MGESAAYATFVDPNISMACRVGSSALNKSKNGNGHCDHNENIEIAELANEVDMEQYSPLIGFLNSFSITF